MALEEDYEGNVDQTAEATKDGDGYVAPEDLAQEVEGQDGEPQGSEAGAEDFLTQEFAYTGEDGKEVTLTGADLLAAVEARGTLEAKVKELEAKPPAATEKPPETKPGEATDEGLPQIAPVDRKQVGTFIQAMLDGGDSEKGIPGMEGMGDALDDLIIRTVWHSPILGTGFARLIENIMDRREAGVKASTSLKEFAGAEFTAEEISAFQKENAWAKGKEAAVAGLTAARLRQENADLKAGKPGEVKAAADKAAKEAAAKLIAAKKAAGTMRVLGGGNGARAGAQTGKKALTGDDRTASALAGLQAMRNKTK